MSEDENEKSPSPPPEKRARFSPKAQRTFSKIPIFIVDYHNDVLEFLYRCLGSRHLPLKGNTLIHFDSHPDMVISRDIKASTIHAKGSEVSDLTSIENWIMPTCYAGHFTQLVWLKNSWCDQMPVGRHNFAIGHKDDILHVSCPLEYFISEGNYCSDDEMENSQKISLQVINLDKTDKEEKFELEAVSQYVLDVDLDFFSTKNPFHEVYGDANCYELLKDIFQYNREGDSPEEVCRKRKVQLENLSELFRYLEKKRKLDNFDCDNISADNLEKIEKLIAAVKEAYEDSEIDWELIYDSGCTCDNGGLPHHISTEAELDGYFQNFTNFLKLLPHPPTAITIARSSEDDYCPQDQVDMIQQKVLVILKDIFQDKLTDEPILFYNDDEWDVMQL